MTPALKSLSRRDFLAIVLMGLLGFIVPEWEELYAWLDGLSTDILLLQRHEQFGQQYPPEQSRVVVVALDELTYRNEHFKRQPAVAWTPKIAQVQDQVIAAGASVLGYDVIFQTSLMEINDPELPELSDQLRRYEKPFLSSLRKNAQAGKLVLGRFQHILSGHDQLSPYRSHFFLVGRESNIRALNVAVDSDGTIRRIPLLFERAEGGEEPSMALELAMRAADTQLTRNDDGKVYFGDYRLPVTQDNSVLLNFQGGADIPTYSLADLYACAQAGDTAYFERHFKDKVVLLGGVLALEDRKLTSKRLMTEQGAAWPAKPCQLPEEEVKQGLQGGDIITDPDLIPGVFIHATGINNLLRQDLLEPIPAEQSRWLMVVLALLVGVISILLRLIYSTLVVLVLLAAVFFASLFAMRSNLLLPVLPMLAVTLVSFFLMLAYRYIVVDRQKLKLKRMFSLYLEPSLVEDMVESEQLPSLGGEMREVTIWFSDLANFTPLSEGLTPEELVGLMNRYFQVITEVIEAHGGYVWQYAGDAVVAVFGAPVEDENHAGHAIATSLVVKQKLKEINEMGEFGEKVLHTRTGINTGWVVAGNVGSSRRFNYTVMGDAVNLAARLEGANKVTKTQILISEAVVKKLPDSFVLREVATLTVKGKQEPTRVYEPLAMVAWREYRRIEFGEKFSSQRHTQVLGLPEEALKISQAFAQAQACYREARFDEMITLLTPFAGDPAADHLIKRAEALIANPPGDDWDGIETLTAK